MRRRKEKKLADINTKLYMIFPYIVTCYYVTYGCVEAIQLKSLYLVIPRIFARPELW